MKILNKYRFARGAKADPPIPKLVPPPNGQNLLKSMSISDSVDALCEGPIYGLVDQFGKKVYGLDMLKGVYLNRVPVMNNAGEYNYRNILMEINLGTENQKPLANFNHVYIFKPANFKLLGKVDPFYRDIRPNNEEFSNSGVERRDFTSWAQTQGGWPSTPQDPFIFVHHVKNKDVRKLMVSFMVDQLVDTISEGSGKGEPGSMGMSKKTSVELFLRWGVEGSKRFYSRRVKLDGIVTSPYAYMIGDMTATVDSTAGSSNGSSATPGSTAPSVGPSQSFGPSNQSTSSVPSTTTTTTPETIPPNGGTPTTPPPDGGRELNGVINTIDLNRSETNKEPE